MYTFVVCIEKVHCSFLLNCQSSWLWFKITNGRLLYFLSHENGTGLKSLSEEIKQNLNCYLRGRHCADVRN